MSRRQKLCLPAPHSKELRDLAGDLYKSGKSYQEIAEVTKLPLSTLRNWCKRDGWKLTKAQPDSELPIADGVPADAEEIPSELSERQTFYTERMSDAACRLAAHVATLEGEQIAAKADKLLKADQVARKALKLDTTTGNPVIQIGVLLSSPAKRGNVVLRNRRE